MKEMRLAFYRFLGVTFSLVGIGGLAGWTETGNGFWLSAIVFSLGIFFLWDENRLNPIDRQWEKLRRERKYRK